MDIVARLKTFMQTTGLTSSQFADTALIPRPTLSQIISGRNKKISNEVFAKLHEAFPALNMMWLIFGDGHMMDDETFVANDMRQANEIENSDTRQSQLNFDDDAGTPFDPKNSSGPDIAGIFIQGEKDAVGTHNLTKGTGSEFPPVINEIIAGATRRTRIPRNADAKHVSKACIDSGQTTPYNNIPEKNEKTEGSGTASLTSDPSRRISSIMVFYNDNSFEIFKPA